MNVIIKLFTRLTLIAVIMVFANLPSLIGADRNHLESEMVGGTMREKCDYMLSILANPHLALAEVFEHADESDFLLNALVYLYPELRWLTNKTDASPEAEGVARSGSPSMRVFGKKFDEFDRSIVGITTMQQVLSGDYQRFIIPQNPKIALSENSFKEIQAFLHAVVPTSEAMDAMLSFMSIHDLGKVKSFVRLINAITVEVSADHDKVLVRGLYEEPIIAPSFIRLSEHYQKLILDGLAADFNMAQFVQGENVAASLKGIAKLKLETMNFFIAHALFDIAGAAGGGFPVGSKVMTEPVYVGFRDAINALNSFVSGVDPVVVYQNFLTSRLRRVKPDFDPSKSEDYALGRLFLMNRFSTLEDLNMIGITLMSLPVGVEALIVEGLNATGIDNWAVLPYYAPALFENLRLGLVGKVDHPREYAIHLGLKILGQVYAQAKRAFVGYEGAGVLTVDLNAIATIAKKDPMALANGKLTLDFESLDRAVAKIEPVFHINISQLPQLQNIGEALPGNKILPIGIGGGSDVIQAAQIGLMARRAGIDVPAVVSVRAAKPESQAPDGFIPTERLLINHGGEIVPGVFRVLMNTAGSGRFLENIPASDFKVYQIILRGDRSFQAQLDAVISDIGGVDNLVAVDTGGDSLYPVVHEATNPSKTTPDQDLHVLRELSKLKYPVISSVVAAGVDSPNNASEILELGKARFYELDKTERTEIGDTYSGWDFTGENPKLYGKTPFAWQEALNGKRGISPINLPTHAVLSKTNPWDPFILLQPATAGVLFMNLADHLKAIGATRP